MFAHVLEQMAARHPVTEPPVDELDEAAAAAVSIQVNAGDTDQVIDTEEPVVEAEPTEGSVSELAPERDDTSAVSDAQPPHEADDRSEFSQLSAASDDAQPVADEA
jgi:hypothetical protein